MNKKSVKMNKLIILIIIILVLIAGCNIKKEVLEKSSNNNVLENISKKTDSKLSPLDLSLVKDFISAGCVYNKGKELNCSSIGLEDKFSCYSISLPGENFKELSSNVSMVTCKFTSFDFPEKGGMLVGSAGEGANWYVKYLVFLNNNIIEIKSKEDFQKFFAPVETSEEALAYLEWMVPSDYSMENIEIPKKYNVLVDKDKIKPTSVVRAKDGFEINLFYTIYETCGSPQPTYEHKYLVKNNGEVTLISKEKIYEGDPGYCT